MTETQTHTEIDTRGILAHLPHRYPMLLIDRVLEFVPGERLVALKNVTANEPCFQGHFPGRPVMPGVLILEAMAQATGIFALRTLGRVADESTVYYFAGVDNARFRRPVVPGDQLRITIEPVRTSRGVWKVRSRAEVDGEVAASAELMGALREV